MTALFLMQNVGQFRGDFEGRGGDGVSFRKTFRDIASGHTVLAGLELYLRFQLTSL